MKIELQFEASDSMTTRFSVTVDGKTRGTLSMPPGKALQFAEIMRLGAEHQSSAFHCSGQIPISEDWVLWHKRSGIDRRETRDRRSGLERRSAKNRRTDKGQRKED